MHCLGCWVWHSPLGWPNSNNSPVTSTSDYYFAGGLQIAAGKGFTEPYLWNYLDDPSGLPHASHSYWMPLSSLIAAAGAWVTHSTSYQAGRLGFLLLAALSPVLTAALAYRFTYRADLAMASGLLAVFSVYYVPFMSVTDNYGPYLVLGALYFLTMGWRKPASYAILGAISGLLTLARSDGLLWLVITAVLIVARFLSDRHLTRALVGGLLAPGGFALITGAWFWHTYSVYGTLLAPGGGHLLWLTDYDETFIYPASQLTFQSWLAQGWGPILAARLMALRWNLLNAFAAQGEIFLLPFLLLGIWVYRRDERVRIALLAWALLLLVMTVIFPFAGARGGFFHSGSAVQPMWWVLAPAGLDRAIAARAQAEAVHAASLHHFPRRAGWAGGSDDRPDRREFECCPAGERVSRITPTLRVSCNRRGSVRRTS